MLWESSCCWLLKELGSKNKQGGQEGSSRAARSSPQTMGRPTRGSRAELGGAGQIQENH